ncbi:DUF1054 domain-containing protein [Caldibacillus lycopersici]|uniref:UPF0637 protein OEV98_01565 n=1 Tax=Perspicuibacillus lycopersici TaxID=1325689 RepID=A0AAE3IPL6_9BACI|nr:DUF1054 domain-containing protein [Perspicuibacillus lycopersici]MCU9612248.1 DUF1054 domain-containing protein [Perspicuibacillus lycopersici]
MTLQGFTKEDFQVFTIDGLDDRMAAIRGKIQPKFQAIGSELTMDLSSLLGDEMYLHIAKHARRTVNPPKDTWLAIGPNKRGYKQYPHFQLGLFDDHLFIWLAYIYELPNKAQIAQSFLNQVEVIKTIIPSDFVISTDHMKKNAQSIKEISLEDTLERFKNVKKAEFLIGRNIPANDPILQNGEALTQLTLDTFKTLIPLYKLSFTS